MYRIELAPGEETVFRTFEELATGVRNGFITPRARIFHSASQKWLPIEFHPHYKRALENPAQSVESPAAKPAERTRGASAGSASAPGLFGSGAPASGGPAGGAASTGAAATGSPASGTPAPGMSTRGAVAPGAVTPPASPHAESSAPLVAHGAPFVPPAAAPVPVTHLSLAIPEGAAIALLSASVAETATDDVVAPEAWLIHSQGMEAPIATEGESVEEPVFLQPVAASQALELPKISYPEITPVEEPVAHRPRTLGRSRRTLQLAGVAVVLVAGAYAVLSVFSSRRAGSAPASVETVADRPAMPAQGPEAPVRADARARVPVTAPASLTSPAHASVTPPAHASATSPAPAPAPARLNPSQPASSGFAPALEPRALVSTAAPKPAVNGPPVSSVDSSLTPPPVALDLAVPELPRADSLVIAPRQHPDSAMKRILRAVSGGKDVPPQR